MVEKLDEITRDYEIPTLPINNGRAYHRDARQMDLSAIDPEFEELNQAFEDDGIEYGDELVTW